MEAPNKFGDDISPAVDLTEKTIGPTTSEVPNEKDENVGGTDVEPKSTKSGLSSQLDQIRNIVLSLVHGMSYTPPNISRNLVLEEALMHIVRSWGIDDGHGGEVFQRIAKYSVALSDLTCYHHEFEVKLQIALLTWFGIYMDDVAAHIPDALQGFQERMHRGLPQLDPVLTHFGPFLLDMYTYFEPLCANAIICGTLDFVSGCALEVTKEVAAMPLPLAALEWPYHLRVKTSFSAPYAYMIFPKKEYSDMSVYLPAMADIIFVISMVNDILSFYKEELDGEEGNYIHNRSKTLGEDPVKVLADVTREVLAARERIYATLAAEPKGLDVWRTYEQGYIKYHLSQERYKLGELDPSLADDLL